MNIKGTKYRRFGRSSLAVTAALLVCGSAVDAQRERPVPADINDDGILALPGSVPAQCPSQEILAGINDTFSTAGVEIAAPSAALQNAVGGPFAQFDGTATNVHFAHTFRLPPCKCLVGAKLEFRAKALGRSCGPSSSSNDAIHLGFSTLVGFPRWSAWFGTGNPPPPPAISTSAWCPPISQVFSLDLAALPGGPSLLSAMQTNKYLDFYVQDDTAIDYIKLTLTMCDCCQPNGKNEICISKFFDENRNGVKDAGEQGLPGWTFQASDQAGGNVVTSPPTTAQGRICFGVLAPATYTISEALQSGWVQSFPVNPAHHVVTVNPGGPVVNLLFGNWKKNP